MNFKIIAYFLGWVLKIESVSMLVPCLVAFANGEFSGIWLLITAFLTGILGLFMSPGRFKLGNYYAKEGYAVTGLSWIVLSLFGALPFWLSGAIPSYVDALFEIVSGFTTTGSSVLSDVEHLGKGLLLFRSFSHWLGGMGVLVLILSLLPQNASGMQIMKAESPGPSVSKLVPRVQDTAKMLYLIYILMTVVMTITYLLSGMPLFDAVCIAFGTAGTGGFAVRNSGMNDYSALSQSLITIWMLLFGVNFNVYFLIVRKHWKDAFRSEEARWYFGLFALFTVLLMLNSGFIYQEEGFFYTLHHMAFTVSSLMTTTGFGTVDFTSWPAFSRILILCIMFLGASAGSTGGGFKISRFILLGKEALNEMHFLVHPNSVRTIRLEGKKVDDRTIRSLNHYFILYMLILVVSILLVSLDGYDLETTISSVFATFNNIGPGLGGIGPYGNYGSFSLLSKLVLIFDMVAGRLEILPMLVILNPRTWLKNS